MPLYSFFIKKNVELLSKGRPATGWHTILRTDASNGDRQ